MGKLFERLQDPVRSGVYRVMRPDEVLDAVKGSEMVVAKVRFAAKEELLKNIAQALDFPDWFGHNWDALEDCLSDLSWREAPGYVLLFEKPRRDDDFGVLIDVLLSSAESWAARRKPFFALFVDPARTLPLPDLFRQS
jgi:RNAse (barnase) inhibitor barstar